MIEIQNNRGQTLLLYPNTTTEHEIESWLLAEDGALPGSHTLPFRFPIRGNESFIGHKHRVEAGGFEGISVTISSNGLPVGAGVLSFRVQNDTADAFIKMDAGEIAAKLRSKYIHDAVLDEKWTLCAQNSDLPAAMLRTTNRTTNPWPFVFFPVYNPEFQDPKLEWGGYTYQPYMNPYTYFLTGQFKPDDLGQTGGPVVPFLYLKYVIERVCNYLGYTAQGAWLQNPNIKALVMYNEVAIDCSGVWGSFTVNAKYHVWQMKLNDFFRFLRDEMAVGVYFDSALGTADFVPFVEIRDTTSAQNLSADLLKGIEVDATEQVGVSLSFVQDKADAYAKELPSIPNYSIGRGEEEVALSVPTLPMTLTDVPGGLGVALGAKWMVAVARRRGISLDPGYKEMGIYNTTFPPEARTPKLLAYWGMQPDSINLGYPYGSSLSRNTLQEQCGGLSLVPDEPDSLFHQYVRPFYEFKAFTKKVTLKFQTKISTLAKLKFFQKISAGHAEMTTLDYILGRMTYALPDYRGRVITQAELYPILPPPESYKPSIPTVRVWVRLSFWPSAIPPVIPEVGTFDIKFQLFTTKEAAVVAAFPRPLTIFYTYKVRGFEAGAQESIEEEKFAVCVIPAFSIEGIIANQLFWVSDDPSGQVPYPDQKYAVRSSFQILPGAGYLFL